MTDEDRRLIADTLRSATRQGQYEEHAHSRDGGHAERSTRRLQAEKRRLLELADEFWPQ